MKAQAMFLIRTITAAACLTFSVSVVSSRCHAEDPGQSLAKLSTSVPASLPTSLLTNDVAGSPTSPPAKTGELREAFAIAVQERNLIRSERDVLQSQKWFAILYGILISAFAIWMSRHLLRRTPVTQVTPDQATTRKIHAPDPATTRKITAPVDARTTSTTRNPQRKNATITIRNSSTQLPEVTDRVATRKFFAPRDPAPIKPALMSQSLADQLGTSTESHGDDDLSIDVDYAPTPSVAAKVPTISKAATTAKIATTTVMARPAQEPTTVPKSAADPQPDYYASKPISRYESVFASPRVKAFSLLEITISIAVLATVLMAVGSGMMSLNTSQKIAREDAAVHEIVHLYAERIMGGAWEWLGRDRSEDGETQSETISEADSLKSGAWSWQREQFSDPKLTALHPPLRANSAKQTDSLSLLLTNEDKIGVANLRLYLEYFTSDAVTVSFTPNAGTSAVKQWAEKREANRMPVPIDLRSYNDAVVVRIAATWDSFAGGQRSHELVFARRK